MTNVTADRVINLFSTPILTGVWDQAITQNPILRDAILNRMAHDNGVEVSNIFGWQSAIGMTKWAGHSAQLLLDNVVEQCRSVTVDLKGSGPAEWMIDMWANVSGAGSANQTHSHPGCYWSAVYYVDDGYAGSDDKNLGGELVFLDPRMPMIRMGVPDLRYCRPDRTPDHHETWMRPKSGLVVIFPSWLMHGVRPYYGQGKRISIAINVSLIARGA
jgi:uncharacterized protein (TIGR02466 family)